MVSAVKSRPNHYETLGLKPTAVGDEIAKAFARATSVFRPHAFGSITEVFMAYETLRDPIKRRAYDASIGLGQKPDAPTAAPASRATPSAPAFVAAYAQPKIAVVHREQTPEPGLPPKPPAKPSAEQAPRPNAAASPRVPLNRMSSENAPVQRPIPEPRIRPSADRPSSFAFDDRFGADAAPIDWRKPAVAVGAVILVACVLGGAAGWWSSSDIEEQAQVQTAVSVPLPRARQVNMATQPATPPQIAAEAAPDYPRRALAAPARAEPRSAYPQVAEAEAQNQQSEFAEGTSGPDPLAPSVAEQDSVPEPALAPAATDLPLPKKVIARTIHRIGYSCGQVVGTSPVEGAAAGVYKVTCSSGQSYQASPVNGRYRFRRLR
jgi:hypothetical protein